MYSGKLVYLTSAIVVVLACGAFAVPVSSQLLLKVVKKIVFLCACVQFLNYFPFEII